MYNQKLIIIFNEIADLLEMQGVQWKPQAYRKAARNIQALTQDVIDIKDLISIPGVGKAIAEKIKEFLETGKIESYEKLRKSVPSGVEDMMHIQGLGPKKAWTLYKKLDIDSVAKLKKAAKENRIQELAGFGEKTEQEILSGISMFKKGKERSLLGVALPVAQELQALLNKQSFIKRAVIAGSIRRRKETIKDIDILVISTHPKKVMDFFTSLPETKKVLVKGPTKSSIILRQGMQADVRVLEEKSFGAGLNYFTGSKEHNVALRQLAIKKGLKLSEYGLFKGKRVVAGRTEQEIYKKLGLPYIEPELREQELQSKQPSLITLKDIQGDLHLHTTWTDGSNSIQEMASKALQLHYKYIAITDHSKSTYVAGGLDAKKLAQHNKEVDEVNEKLDIRIFRGSEVDIKKDGSLDYDNKTLKELDVVIASVHAGMKMDKATATQRLLKAINNRYTRILGHPTTRIINKRPGFEFDVDKVFQAAKDSNVALEINANPLRLDLRDTHIRRAIEIGAKLVINTDAHALSSFAYMQYGVATARRGGASPKDIINTLSVKKLEKFLGR
jgi:DNA polymerase (family X)